VGEGVKALGVRAAYLVLLANDGATLELLAPAGYASHVREQWRHLALNADVPIAEAVRSGTPIYIESPAALASRYPEMAAAAEAQDSRAWVALPFCTEGRTIGALGLSFGTPHSFGPEEQGFLATLADVCAQALARARLYEATQAAWASAEAQRHGLRQALDLLPEAVLIADTTPSFRICNAAAQAILGVDVTGLPVPCMDDPVVAGSSTWRPDGGPWPTRDLPLQRALFSGEAVQGEQLVVRHATSGQDTLVLANSVPLRNVDGAITGAMVVFQDISAFKELNRQRDEFLASVSHDLKNPLTSILGVTQLLQRRAQRLEVPEHDRIMEGLATVSLAATRMVGQIDELLDSTRMQMGQPLMLEPEPTDLVALIGSLVTECRQTTERHEIHLSTAESALVMSVDKARIERALANVIGNALKYSPDGGTIVVSLRSTEEANGATATISVADQGMGIPPDELPRVFERFYRASNAIGWVAGTGLGLAGVRRIVEQHGGTIAVESALGSGTTVTISLPVIPAV
jgi:signal transduction histidine kinase